MRVYYKLDYSSIERIPFGKPVVLAPNHVNAFIDPIIIAMLPSYKVRFFARGDVFKGKFVKFLLNSINISPIYRIQEGYSEVKKNDKTFQECKKLLSEDKTIMLFPEGICIQEKRLHPLKKGMARIVFQTAQSMNYSKDIFIVPIGLNYEDAKRFRSKLYIDFGEPVSLAEYIERFKTDPVRTINEFTKIVEGKMKQQLLIINNPENDAFADQLMELFVKDWTVTKGKDITKLINEYESSKEIVELINYFDVENKTALEELKKYIADYFILLKKDNLRAHLLHPAAISTSNFVTFLIEFIKLYIGFPFYLLGLLTNYPPYYLAKEISNKKVKEVEFYASFYSNVAMILWLLFYPTQLLIIALLFKNWLFFGIYAIAVPLLGIYVLEFYPFMKKTLGRWRLLRMVRKNKHAIQQLIELRGEINHRFEKMKEFYFSVYTK